jgi:hypothetical protein
VPRAPRFESTKHHYGENLLCRHPESRPAKPRVNPNIREADREAGIAAVERAVNASKGMSDKEANLLMKGDLLPADMQTPAGKVEVAPRRAAPRATPRATATGNPESYGAAPRSTVTPSRGNENDYSMNAQEGSGNINYGGGAAARAPSRGDYSRNGPIGDTVDAISGLMSRLPRGRAAAKRALQRKDPMGTMPMKKGGVVKASKRGDGIAQRGKTKGRLL